LEEPEKKTEKLTSNSCIDACYGDNFTNFIYSDLFRSKKDVQCTRKDSKI
jgi:hypothetical protein